jgi:hypothetical protein
LIYRIHREVRNLQLGGYFYDSVFALIYARLVCTFGRGAITHVPHYTSPSIGGERLWSESQRATPRRLLPLRYRLQLQANYPISLIDVRNALAVLARPQRWLFRVEIDLFRQSGRVGLFPDLLIALNVVLEFLVHKNSLLHQGSRLTTI